MLSMVTLAVWAPATTMLSGRLGETVSHGDRPILWFVAMQIIAGLAYLGVLRGLQGVERRRLWTMVVLALGLALRLVLMASTPILEDDYQRYLLDGATVAHGFDPYRYSPQELLSPETSLSPERQQLVQQGKSVIEQINHPDLRTIYPPVAQGLFALAYHVQPWTVLGLRLVWLVLDLVTLGLLAWGLRSVASGGVRLASLAVYWLNPLLVKEVYSSAHMELIVLTFATAGLVLAAKKHSLGAGVMLALGAGAKLWPVLWVGLLVRWFRDRPWQAVRLVVAFALTLGLVLWPMMRGLAGEDSGFVSYTQRWEMNDTAFMLILWPLQWFGLVPAQLIARAVVGLMVLFWLLWQARRGMRHDRDLYGRALAIVAMMFLWSPTQFPWYALWFLPVLALYFHWPLLWLTVTLPLYYLRTLFAQRGAEAVFDHGIVWLEFAPVWVLLARWWWHERRLSVRAMNA